MILDCQMANLKCKLKLGQDCHQFHYHCHHHYHKLQKPIKMSIKMTYNVPRYFRVFSGWKQFILFHLLMHKPLNLKGNQGNKSLIILKIIISLRHKIFHYIPIFHKFLNIKKAPRTSILFSLTCKKELSVHSSNGTSPFPTKKFKSWLVHVWNEQMYLLLCMQLAINVQWHLCLFRIVWWRSF